MAKTLIGNIKGPKGDTGPQGPAGVQGPAGPQGPQGPAGYTPVKGRDYFTEEDKRAFAPAYTYGTADLNAGSSGLATGTLYFVYE